MENRYWVRWTGRVRLGEGVPFDSASPRLHEFVCSLTKAFSIHSDLSQPAVLSPGNGTITLTSVVEAQTRMLALAKALEAFGVCISMCGWKSNLPETDHDSWGADQLGQQEPALVEDPGNYDAELLGEAA